MNFERRIKNYVRNADTQNPEPMECKCNYMEMTPYAKINALDSIIHHMSAVYGPVGGVVGTLDGNTKENEIFITSKDGHHFISELKFNDRYAESILANIHGITRYITDYKDKTSKDGTTSLALISSSISKFMLLSYLDIEKKIAEGCKISDFQIEYPKNIISETYIEKINKIYADAYKELSIPDFIPYGLGKIPSSVISNIFDIMKEQGSIMYDNERVPIYDPKTESYIAEGYQYAIDAVRTSVDRDPVVVKAFKELMDTCVKEKYDITNTFIDGIEREDGNPEIKFRIQSGARIVTPPIKKFYSETFTHNSYLFILNGYISEANSVLFCKEFRSWLEKLLSMRSQEGVALFGNTPDKLDPPVFIITRTPDYMLTFYREIQAKGINVVNAATNESYTIKPKFLFTRDEDQFQNHFADFEEVFSASKFDLNIIEHYINERRDESLYNLQLGKWKEFTYDEGIAFSHLFPSITGNVTKYIRINSDDKVMECGRKIPTVKVKSSIKTDDLDNQTESPDLETFELEELLCTMNFDGYETFIKPISKSGMKKLSDKRAELVKMVNNLNTEANVSTDLIKRMNYFTGLTLTPVIVSRSESEHVYYLDLVQDALGVYVSIHHFGVMGGANTFFIKRKYQFIYNVLQNMYKWTEGVEAKKRLEFLHFAEICANNVIDGYEYIYSILDSNYKDNINSYQNTIFAQDPMMTYNIVNGHWKLGSVVEAARTTADVFSGSLTLSKDMLMIKRLNFNRQYESERTLDVANRIRPVHKINLLHASEEDKEKLINASNKELVGVRVNKPTTEEPQDGFIEICVKKFKNLFKVK